MEFETEQFKIILMYSESGHHSCQNSLNHMTSKLDLFSLKIEGVRSNAIQYTYTIITFFRLKFFNEIPIKFTIMECWQ